jgi:hypothetical protein
MEKVRQYDEWKVGLGFPAAGLENCQMVGASLSPGPVEDGGFTHPWIAHDRQGPALSGACPGDE